MTTLSRADPRVHVLLDPERDSGACAYVVKGWLDTERCASVHALLTAVPGEMVWSQPIVKVYGSHPTPRLIASAADGERTHSYSGITLQSQSWDGAEKGSALYELRRIRRRICRERLYFLTDDESVGDELNSCLLNRYRDGKDYIAAHGDKELRGEHTTVATVSLGASRKFRFRSKSGIHSECVLESGDLCVMYGPATQRLFTHEVPKQAGVGERISLTYRVLD